MSSPVHLQLMQLSKLSHANNTKPMHMAMVGYGKVLVPLESQPAPIYAQVSEFHPSVVCIRRTHIDYSY